MIQALPEHALFLYGSLMPGGSAENILQKIEGSFIKAHIFARFSPNGWGHTEHYPCVILDEKAGKVEGFLFLSSQLETILPELDAYEREEYQRVRYHATTQEGSVIACQVYELADNLKPNDQKPDHIGV